MEYVVVEVGTRQYKVKKGDKLVVDKLPIDVGEKVALKVLMYRDDNKILVGKPYVDGKVEGVVTRQFKGHKMIVFKKKKRKKYAKKEGYRDSYSELLIETIEI